MFGFAIADAGKLSDEARERYRAVYCGVCRAIGQDRKKICRVALTYDLVLPALILSDVSGTPFQQSEIRCGVHPVKKRKAFTNEYTDYAADMNVLLAFYNFLDDLNDDGGFVPAAEAALFWDAADAVKQKYPDLSDTLQACLKEISDAEKRDERRADIPAAAFGRLLGSVFGQFDLPCREALYEFGCALGKAIYFMDAAVDVKADLKKKRYNPLIGVSFDERRKLLEFLLADCVRKAEKLPLKQEKEIVDNILLSGVWTRYDLIYRKKNAPNPAGETE